MNKISRNKNVPKIMILCYIMTVQEPICVILTDDVRIMLCNFICDHLKKIKTKEWYCIQRIFLVAAMMILCLMEVSL